jgi:hypothetical protein
MYLQFLCIMAIWGLLISRNSTQCHKVSQRQEMHVSDVTYDNG